MSHYTRQCRATYSRAALCSLYLNRCILYIADDVKGKLQFLERHIDPWNVVFEYWEVTSEVRTRALQRCKDERNVDEYLQAYPALREKLGYTLVCIFLCVYIFFSAIMKLEPSHKFEFSCSWRLTLISCILITRSKAAATGTASTRRPLLHLTTKNPKAKLSRIV